MIRIAAALLALTSLSLFSPAQEADHKEDASAAAGSQADLIAEKETRLKRLADLLETVSDEEYQEALKQLPAEKASRPELASRGSVLKSAYVTLAALEYRQASAQAAKDLARLANEDAKSLAVDPASLQETGWFMDFLGVAAAGGAGFLIFENQRKHQTKGGPIIPSPAPQTSSAPPTTPVQNGAAGGCISRGLTGPDEAGFVEWEFINSCGVDRVVVACHHVGVGYDKLSITVPANGSANMNLGIQTTQSISGPMGVTWAERPYPGGGFWDCPIQNGGGTVQASARVSSLNGSLDGMRTELAGLELGSARSTEIHRKMGSVYELLASTAAAAEAATPPKARLKRAAGPAVRDILLLWDGSRLDGEVRDAGSKKIVIKTDAGMMGIKQGLIQALIFRGPEVDAESDEVRASASAEKLPLILKADGTSARGRLVAASPRQLVFQTPDGTSRFSREEVRAVVFPGP